MVVVLVTGTPGVGKTTVAKALAKLLGVAYVNVGEIAKERGLLLGLDAERGAYEVDVDAVRNVLRELLRGGAVIDTHLVDAVPEDLVDVVIVLRLDPRVLLRRLRERGYPGLKVRENVECEILDCCLSDAVSRFGHDRVFEVDVTGLKPEEAVKLVVSIVESRKGPRPGSVDWVSKLGNELESLLRSLASPRDQKWL